MVSAKFSASFFRLDPNVFKSMSSNNTLMPTHSDAYEELMLFYRSLAMPYTKHDIRAFNAIYRCIYRSLSREERNRAEEMVDLMIEGLENPQLAEMIYGVV